MPDYRDSWDLAGRDVVPDLTASGRPSDVGAALLYALLVSDDADWSPHYDTVRRALAIRSKPIEPEREEQADQRIRTWMVFFRGLGLELGSHVGDFGIEPFGLLRGGAVLEQGRVRIALDRQGRDELLATPAAAVALTQDRRVDSPRGLLHVMSATHVGPEWSGDGR